MRRAPKVLGMLDILSEFGADSHSEFVTRLQLATHPYF